MVFPSPEMADTQMDEARAGITLDHVVQFIRDAPPEFIDYLMELLSQQSARNAPPPDPALNAALESVAPAPPPMR